jgi:hypothetical protein
VGVLRRPPVCADTHTHSLAQQHPTTAPHTAAHTPPGPAGKRDEEGETFFDARKRELAAAAAATAAALAQVRCCWRVACCCVPCGGVRASPACAAPCTPPLAALTRHATPVAHLPHTRVTHPTAGPGHSCGAGGPPSGQLREAAAHRCDKAASWSQALTQLPRTWRCTTYPSACPTATHTHTPHTHTHLARSHRCHTFPPTLVCTAPRCAV